MIVGGSVTDPVLIENIVCPAGWIVFSFQAELHTILSGLRWLRDSYSVFMCLRNSSGGLPESLIAKCAGLLSFFLMPEKFITFVSE